MKAVSFVVGCVVPTRWLKAFAIRYNTQNIDLSGVPDSWIPPVFLRAKDL